MCCRIITVSIHTMQSVTLTVSATVCWTAHNARIVSYEGVVLACAWIHSMWSFFRRHRPTIVGVSVLTACDHQLFACACACVCVCVQGVPPLEWKEMRQSHKGHFSTGSLRMASSGKITTVMYSNLHSLSRIWVMGLDLDFFIMQQIPTTIWRSGGCLRETNTDTSLAGPYYTTCNMTSVPSLAAVG